MSIDLGLKKIGVAYKIQNSSIAFSKGVFFNDNTFLDFLFDFIKSQQTNLIVIGDPKSSNLTFGTQHVIEFSKKILHFIEIDIVLQDETMTSRRADQNLEMFFEDSFHIKIENNQIRHKRQKDKNKESSVIHLENFKQMRKQRQQKDAHAACIILERFMEN